MAEEMTKGTQGTENSERKETEVTGGEERKDAPTVDDLMAQIASLRSENQSYQNKYNQASKEASEAKKALRAKQTAEEREAEEKAEAQRLADEERENMRKELNHIKAVAAYKGISSEKSVERLIEAVSEADHNAIAEIIENETKAAVNAAKAEWLKERPRVNTGGTYSGMTKEQIMAIPDREKRRAAIAENMELFGK